MMCVRTDIPPSYDIAAVPVRHVCKDSPPDPGEGRRRRRKGDFLPLSYEAGPGKDRPADGNKLEL